MTGEERALFGLPCIQVRIKPGTTYYHGLGGRIGWLVEKYIGLMGVAILVELDNGREWFDESQIEVIHDK